MKKWICIELKNCLKRLEVKIVFSIVFIISISSYLANAYNYYGYNLSDLRSAHELSIIQSLDGKFLLQIIVISLPLLSCIIYSDTYYTDYKTRIYKTVLTRIKKQDYFISKAIVNFYVTFFVFFIPLLFNEILNIISFPIKGSFNNYGHPSYYIEYLSSYLFEMQRIQSPFIYNLIYIIIISIFAAVFSLLGYSIQLYYKKNRFTVPILIFIFYIILDIFGNFINSFKAISILGFLQPGQQGQYWMIIIVQIILLLFSMLLIFNKIKDEVDL